MVFDQLVDEFSLGRCSERTGVEWEVQNC